jgi:hypothetical protein
VYLAGRHENQPRHLYSGILTGKLGSEPHVVPGAVIPGLCSVGDYVVFIDDYHEYRCVETIIDVSATLVFAAHALDKALIK